MSPVEAHEKEQQLVHAADAARSVVELQQLIHAEKYSDNWVELKKQIEESSRQAMIQQMLVDQQWIFNPKTMIGGTVVVTKATYPIYTATLPEGDPDGPLVPLPADKTANRTPYATPAHDYIAALYRPYVSPV